MHVIERLSRDLFAAEESGQTSEPFLRNVLTADFTITRFRGTSQDIEQYIRQVRSSTAANRRIDRYAIREYGECAIAQCVVTIPPGAPNDGEYQNIQVFIKAGADWHCAAWQTTKIVPVT